MTSVVPAWQESIQAEQILALDGPASPTLGKASGFQAELADQSVSWGHLIKSKRLRANAWLILAFLCSWLKDFLTTKPSQKESAFRLRKLFEDLGPIYIKIGQFLSFRADILPKEFVAELKLLQDSVAPFDFAQVKQTIENDLGQKLTSLFLAFEKKPIAAASLGQVYRARLLDGQIVAVKVQRPNLETMIYEDLGCLRFFARLMRFCGQDHSQSLFDLSSEFGQMLFGEIDYIAEGKNADKLRHLFYLSPQIKIPKVIWKYTGHHVLTTQYLPGIKIDSVSEIKAARLDLKDLTNLIVECFAKQVLSAGFFHADPHPGNMATDSLGNLILYDFGMMGTVSIDEKRALFNLVLSVAEANASLLAESLIDLKIVEPMVCRQTLSRLLEPLITCYQGNSSGDWDFAQIEADCDRLIKNNAFKLPVSLTYLIRAACALEGVVRTIKPDFNFARALSPHLLSWTNSQLPVKYGDKRAANYTFVASNL